MKTDDLIERLAARLTPVRPLAPPGKRAALWLMGSALYLGAMILGVSGFDTTTGGMAPGLLLSQSIGVLAGALAVFAAFSSVVPGDSRRALIVTALATLAWLAWFAVVVVSADDAQAIAASRHEWVCVAMILAGGAPLAATLAIMLRKGAPLHPMLTGVLVAIAVGLLANFSACISLPHGNAEATFAWHGAALAILVLCCAVGARFVFTWRGAG
ncbi:MAG TPA: NrsF family protein [Gammaproteobacteria bacterium]|nr:NrsF family protein [Gammaproteobacteria bacterium]